MASGKPTASAMPERTASSRRRWTSATQKPGDRAELGADDHRADDQDRRSRGRCRPPRSAPASTMNSRNTADSSTFSFVRSSTSSQTTASAGAPRRVAFGARRRSVGDRGVDDLERDRALLVDAEVLAGRTGSRSRPRARRRTRIMSPSGLRAGSPSLTMLTTEGVQSSTSITASVRSGGETIRRWTMAASVPAGRSARSIADSVPKLRAVEPIPCRLRRGIPQRARSVRTRS